MRMPAWIFTLACLLLCMERFQQTLSAMHAIEMPSNTCRRCGNRRSCLRFVIVGRTHRGKTAELASLKLEVLRDETDSRACAHSIEAYAELRLKSDTEALAPLLVPDLLSRFSTDA